MITIYNNHRWQLSYDEAHALQRTLQKRIRLKPVTLKSIRFIAGADIAVSKKRGMLIGVVVVLRFPDLDIVEARAAVKAMSFPYIPGLLSFREIPVLLDCLRSVRTPFDAMICDGQGIAHPRHFGLASHLGLLLRRPTIGCAKSRLIGAYGPVGMRRGDFAALNYRGRRVGSVLRTRVAVKPVFVSPGHLADQLGSRRIVLSCATRYRLPEPIRFADRLAGEEKRRLEG
jgi:deoxyribonuclease V